MPSSELLACRPIIGHLAVAVGFVCRMMMSLISLVRKLSKLSWIFSYNVSVFFYSTFFAYYIVQQSTSFWQCIRLPNIIRIFTCIQVSRLHQYQQFRHHHLYYKVQSHHHVHHHLQFQHCFYHKKHLKVVIQALVSFHVRILCYCSYCRNCQNYTVSVSIIFSISLSLNRFGRLDVLIVAHPYRNKVIKAIWATITLKKVMHEIYEGGSGQTPLCSD